MAIIGYGIEGQDAEKFLKSKSAKVTILDQKDNLNYLNNLNKYGLIVRSPGCIHTNQNLKNIKVTTSTQVFFEEFKGKTIGVTGTKERDNINLNL